MANVIETTKKINAAADRIQFQPGDDISRVIRFGLIDTGAGNDASCFTNWFFSSGDIRHIAAYSHYIIWFAQNEASFSLDQLKEMVHWIRQPGEFCGYCGYREIWELVQDLLSALDEVKTRDELVQLMNAMWAYGSALNAWIYHYIPWGVGYLFPIRDEKYFEEGLRLARMK
jgi:hypothetical protein